MIWKTVEYTGWGRAQKATGALARPERLASLKTLLKSRPAPAIGNCRSYGDACLNSGGDAIEMTRLDRFLSFDAKTGVLEVEAGVTLGEILRVFSPRGWIPAVLPGTGFCTVGGAIANDVHGKNHHVAGSFGAHVISFLLLTAEGQKVVKAGTPLFKATLGGLGQTGVIAAATLQLARAEGDVMQVRESRVDGFDAFVAALEASAASYSVGWIDAGAQGAALGRGILEEAEIGRGTPAKSKGAKRVPFDAPGFFLSRPIVKLFNAGYLRRVPERGRKITRAMDDFFFPLDRIHDWNRLYGKRGFYQFQCVVPVDQIEALREIIREIAASGLASPLAVLKRMGAGRAGLMSFPMEGFTLAVDIPNSIHAAPLIGTLEALVHEAGGRIYLAKDGLASAKVVRAMYPEAPAFAKAITAADPDGKFATDMVRRLKLRDMA